MEEPLLLPVITADLHDIPAWLALAAQVEPLFGPHIADPGFNAALRRNIARGTAFCIRRDAGPPGAPLLGGLLFSPKPPIYTLGWLAVAEGHRRHGIGRQLVEHALGLVQPPAEVVVTTFGSGSPAGEPARRFFRALGFRPAEPAPDGPEGGSRQVFRRAMPPRGDRV
jgi:GNAT superfamily N-acetyltransferase